MDHQDGGERPRSIRLHQVPAHGAGVAAGRRIGHVARLDTAVCEGNLLRLRVVRHQPVRDRQRARAESPGALQELAPVYAAVAILVVKIEHLLVDFGLRNRGHCISLAPIVNKCARR